MGKRVITLGTLEGEPLEWIVLKKESFGTLVISKWSIGHRCFNGNSGNNNWSDSDLRKYLNDEFFKTAFSDDDKKKIVNSLLCSDNTKDNVFILTKDEVSELLLKCGSDDYENNCWKDCSCCIWTRTKNGSCIYHGYATKGCWCNHHYPNNSYAVRPAMYIKE